MNGQPNNPQAVVYNISHTNGNNYVNATTPEAARAECPTEHMESQKQARAPPSPPLDVQHMSQDKLTPPMQIQTI